MRFIVARSFIILLISCSLLFFSLFFGLNKLSNSPLLIFFFFLRWTQTQTHPHTNTSIQTNQHRDTLAKKKNTKIHKHPYTNRPKWTNNKETNWCLSEWSELVGLAWSELVGLAWSKLMGMGLAWSELGRYTNWSMLVDRS